MSVLGNNIEATLSQTSSSYITQHPHTHVTLMGVSGCGWVEGDVEYWGGVGVEWDLGVGVDCGETYVIMTSSYKNIFMIIHY